MKQLNTTTSKLTLEPVVRIDWFKEAKDLAEVFKLLLLLRL